MYKKITLLFIVALLFTVSHAQVFNAGVGGNNTAQLLERVDADVLAKSPDLVVLMVGTNDMINRNKILPYDVYEENYRALIKQFKDNGTEVLVMSSPRVDSTYVYMRHPRSLFQQATPNEKLDTARLIVEQIVNDYELHYLDLNTAFAEIGIPNHNKDLFVRNAMNSGAEDGVHPTSLGYHFIATNVFQYLKSHKLLHADMKIVCFGDSITYGQGSKGAGKTTGEAYPGYLNRMVKAYLAAKAKKK